MPSSIKNSDIMLEQLAEGLESNTKLAQGLLRELKESERDFAAVRTELNILSDNVKSLSRLVRDGNGEMSLLTRIAVIDQKVQDIQKWVDNHPKEHTLLIAKIDDLNSRFTRLETMVVRLSDTADQEQRAKMDSITRDAEFSHYSKITEKDTKANKQKALITVVVALILGVISLAVAYFTKGGGAIH